MGMENLEGKETTGTPSTDNSQNSVADSTKNESDAVAKRHSEQLEGSKKEVEFYKSVTAVQKDITKLVSIADSDTKTARRIVKEITEGTQYEGKSLEEIISIIK
jgi:myo-inositol-hexaphosphate 3-phosphohydrolase